MMMCYQLQNFTQIRLRWNASTGDIDTKEVLNPKVKNLCWAQFVLEILYDDVAPKTCATHIGKAPKLSGTHIVLASIIYAHTLD